MSEANDDSMVFDKIEINSTCIEDYNTMTS